VDGRRYRVSTEDQELENRRDGVGGNKRTGQFVGGGVVSGAITGAIAGDGKGAAVGAVAGAGPALRLSRKARQSTFSPKRRFVSGWIVRSGFICGRDCLTAIIRRTLLYNTNRAHTMCAICLSGLRRHHGQDTVFQIPPRSRVLLLFSSVRERHAAGLSKLSFWCADNLDSPRCVSGEGGLQNLV